MRIALVTGTRERLTDAGEQFVFDHLLAEMPDLVLIGDCPTGIDAFAADCSWYNTEVFRADWDRFGKAAGPKRNKTMVAAAAKYQDEGHTVRVLAFPVIGSKGTRNCIHLAHEAGLKVKKFDVTQYVDNTPGNTGNEQKTGNRNMAFGSNNQAQSQSLSRSAGGGDRRAPLSRLMGEATMGNKRLPNLPLGKVRVRIDDTKQAQKSMSLVVEGTIVAVADGVDPKLVNTKFSRVFKFGGESKGQPEARTAEWCRFVVGVAGVEDLDALEAAGEDPFNLLDRSALSRGELLPGDGPEESRTAKPLVGCEVDVETTDTGKVTAANPKSNYAGGDPIHDNYWAPAGTLVAREAA